MSIITLTTDFGAGSPYVAAMKGVILSINPAATIVDITHDIPPQDIRHGGAGAGRRGRLVSRRRRSTWRWSIRAWAPIGRSSTRGSASSSYVAPDNGLLSRLAARTPPAKIIRLAERRVLAGAGLDDVPRPRHHGPGGRPAEPGARSRPARPAARRLTDARLARSRVDARPHRRRGASRSTRSAT